MKRQAGKVRRSPVINNKETVEIEVIPEVETQSRRRNKKRRKTSNQDN